MSRHFLMLGGLAVLGLSSSAPVYAQSASPYPGVPSNPLDNSRSTRTAQTTTTPEQAPPPNRYSAPQGQNGNQPAPPPSDRPLSSGLYQDHEPLLQGLAELKLKETRIHRKDIINIRRHMPLREVLTLMESVNSDRQVYHNAERLTMRLQDGGLLHAGDRVLGYKDGKVYAIIGGVFAGR